MQKTFLVLALLVVISCQYGRHFGGFKFGKHDKNHTHPYWRRNETHPFPDHFPDHFPNHRHNRTEPHPPHRHNRTEPLPPHHNKTEPLPPHRHNRTEPHHEHDHHHPKNETTNNHNSFHQKQKKIAQEVNNMHTTWKAAEYEKDYTPLLGAILNGGEKLPPKVYDSSSNDDLPDNFDLREQYPNCESIKEIRDQANCGSCWAFGAAEAMSDRVCIASGQTDQRRVSAQNLLTCCSSCGYGCNGGYPSSAWSYWKNTGIVTGGLYGDKTTCQPYFLPMCDHHIEGSHGTCPDTVDTPSCVKNCDDGNKGDYTSDLIKASSAYSVSGEANIMKDIYNNGSVEASFTVYDDFVTYKSGIYQHVTGSYLGGHAIKMIGWGVEDGVKYWLCVNSWNDEWGENGLFRILRGSNECGIERSVNAGLPKL